MSNVFTAGRGMNAQDLTRLAAGVDGTYAFPATAGGAVTVSSGMTVAVAAIVGGAVTINGTIVATAYVAGTVTLDAADPTNPRIDSIYYDTAGLVDNATGTAVAVTSTTGPVSPTLSATQIRIADIYVAAGATTISSGDITDRRQAVQTAFASIRALFRASRRLIAETAAVGQTLSTTDTIYNLPGTGGALQATAVTAPAITNTAATGTTDSYAAVATGASGIISWGFHTTRGAIAAGTLGAVVRPDKNPIMMIRWFPGASNANLTTTMAGFLAGGASLSDTANGAYLRANTTGNLFFVTRQGGTETTTDLGARPTTPTSYEIYTEDAGVTWYCRNNTTATLVATHTTNVPTATTALAYAVGARSASGSLNGFNLTYLRVECGMGAA